jgi:8-oxo-dGTP pyrophosphatase MutT (NUDIX family)
VTKPLAENNEHVCCGTLIHTPHWSHLLIVAHRKAKTWLPAGGGHLEIDEHPKDCIVRECHEELGCSIERSQLILIDYFSYVLKVPNARCHIHHDLFYRYEVKEMFEPAQSDEFAYECSAWKWVPLEEALTLISYPHITTLIQRIAHDAVSLHTYPHQV